MVNTQVAVYNNHDREVVTNMNTVWCTRQPGKKIDIYIFHSLCQCLTVNGNKYEIDRYFVRRPSSGTIEGRAMREATQDV